MAVGDAGHSGTPLPQKLGLKRDSVFTVLHEPDGFAELLGDVGGAVHQRSLLPPLDVIVTFHRSRATLRTEWPKLTKAAEPSGEIWVAWPKPTSDVPTEITEDVLRADLLKTGWVDNKMCAIDETWSGLRFVQRVTPVRPKDRAKAKKG